MRRNMMNKTIVKIILAMTIGHVTQTHAVEMNSIKQPSSIVVQHFENERAKAGLTHKHIQIGQITWHYLEGGNQQSPSILLLHGLAANKDHWNRVAQYLTPHYHVIIPDLPHNGETVTPANFDNSIPNVTAELRKFAETLKIESKLNIAGHSLGGSFATVYASTYPFDTQSLFLLNSVGIFKQANTPYTKTPQKLKQLIIHKPGDFDQVMHRVMQNPPAVSNELKKAQELSLISASQKNSQMVDQLIRLNQIYTPDSFARLTKNIEAPTLILWGKQDKIINSEVATELQSLLKRAEAPVILNNVGHMPLLEAETAVAQYYLPFLSKTQKLRNPLADKLIPLN